MRALVDRKEGAVRGNGFQLSGLGAIALIVQFNRYALGAYGVPGLCQMVPEDVKEPELYGFPLLP